MKKIYNLLLLITIVGLICTGCGGETDASGKNGGTGEIKLSYAFFAPENTFPGVQMEKWAKELTERTDGKVKVDLFAGGTLLEASNMYDGVRDGIADIGMSATSYEPNRFPLLTISDLPSDYPNSYVASRTIYDLIQEYPPEAFDDFKIIAAFAGEPSYIQTKKKIETIDDMRGQRLRISGSLSDIATKLGASPVGMSQSDVPESLQTGVIDGYITSRETLKDFHLGEMIGHITDYPLHVNTFVAVMNKETWDSLPEDVQAIIDELGEEMAIFTGEYHDTNVQESIEWSQTEHGTKIISLSEEERKKWDEIISPIQNEYVEKLEKEGYPAKEYQARLFELIEKYSNE
ncbi:TRAP transporter substrate-binding protein [Sporosarcina sp. ACRSM]|uniref:TRAP transporter substrate-binding protein n=1 Tax=Sporosarcina sp. ACRSM TaxID=2918216 RepID=UPI001EF4679C|nr:TRAP transporter substrate-binding protein [Sporosarcina sp. ACRSM]MCG7335870.1 TRAP transporter substrate-binding protein [Sporosarcina sp. ACRSM]